MVEYIIYDNREMTKIRQIIKTNNKEVITALKQHTDIPKEFPKRIPKLAIEILNWN